FRMQKFSRALLTACLGAAAVRGETVPGRRVAAATIAPLASLTATVAGPGWEVRTVIPPGVSPHVFEPAPRDVKRFAPARIVVTVGAGYDDWARKLVAACASDAVLHDAGRSVGVVWGGGASRSRRRAGRAARAGEGAADRRRAQLVGVLRGRLRPRERRRDRDRAGPGAG